MGRTIEMKLAKATDRDIERCIRFFQFIDEFMEHGTCSESEDAEPVGISEEDFVEKLRELWGGRLRAAGVDASWMRVVFGCSTLIQNCCDPDADTLEWKPEIAELLKQTEKTDADDGEPVAETSE